MLWRSLSVVLAIGFSVSHSFQIVEDLATNCQFTLGDDKLLNLCSLTQRVGNVLEYELPTSSLSHRAIYRLNVAGDHDTSVSGEEQCPPGNWICLTALNSRGYAPRQLRITGIFDSEHTSPLHASINDDPRGYQARIFFHCDQDRDVKGLTSPIFTGEAGGIHSFVWTTRHACSTSPTSPTFAINQEETPAPGDEKEESDDGNELLDPLPVSNRRYSTATIFFLTVSGLVILGYLFYSPPAIVQRYVTAYMKPVQFRATEGRILHWAQEDMELLEGEEDVMINGAMDEQIPLKPSPPQRRLFANYGSAP